MAGIDKNELKSPLSGLKGGLGINYRGIKPPGWTYNRSVNSLTLITTNKHYVLISYFPSQIEKKDRTLVQQQGRIRWSWVPSWQ